MIERLRKTQIELNEEQTNRLQTPETDWYTVEARLSRDQDLPAAPELFIQGIQEKRTKWLGLRNTSPVIAFEVRRNSPDKLRFQYSVPTKRLERKLRNHLSDTTPRVELSESGVDGLPVNAEDTIGGGTVTMGRTDWYPLETEFDAPPINALVGSLHHEAMKDSIFVVQVLLRPVAGKPVRRWWYRKSAYRQISYLRSEKELLIGRRKPTSKEKKQARKIDDKVTSTLFEAAIRAVVIGAGDHTPSRLHEVLGGYNQYESRESGQSLNGSVETAFRETSLVRFYRSVADRRFPEKHRRFRVSTPELAALVSLPDRSQENIRYARPQP
jgi:hypothetical protein